MPERPDFPGYTDRANERFRILCPGGNKNEFARERGVESWQVTRWLKSMPASFKDLERWSAALGVPTAWLLVGEAGYRAIADWERKGRPVLPPPERRVAPRSLRPAGTAKEARRK